LTRCAKDVGARDERGHDESIYLFSANR
jgi:hypothetical protein